MGTFVVENAKLSYKEARSLRLLARAVSICFVDGPSPKQHVVGIEHFRGHLTHTLDTFINFRKLRQIRVHKFEEIYFWVVDTPYIYIDRINRKSASGIMIILLAYIWLFVYWPVTGVIVLWYQRNHRPICFL